MHKKLISENISDADAESLFNDKDFDKNYASDDVSHLVGGWQSTQSNSKVASGFIRQAMAALRGIAI